jgi:hypothetical protein
MNGYITCKQKAMLCHNVIDALPDDSLLSGLSGAMPQKKALGYARLSSSLCGKI